MRCHSLAAAGPANSVEPLVLPPHPCLPPPPPTLQSSGLNLGPAEVGRGVLEYLLSYMR